MSEKILLVDDEEGIRKVLKIYLSDLGYDVYTAACGEEALRIFEEVRPPIVFTDIKMPGMDGISLLKKIKKDSPETEVVMITGHGDMELAIKSLKLDATDFITKPINDDVLDIALKRARERISMRREIRAHTKNLEERVREQSARLQQLFEEVPCYITVQDRDLRINAANRRFREDFGNIHRGFCYDVYKHRDSPCPECPVLKTFEDENSHQAEMVVTSKSLEQYNVLIWTAPIRDQDGRVTRVMEMSTNITRVRHLQDHLASLGLLIGSVSHSIKGMLTGLDGGMYMLDDGISRHDVHEISEGRDIIRQTVGRIRKMVLDILYYAKEREMDVEPVDASRLAEAAAAVRSRIKDSSIFLHCGIPDGLGEVEVDAPRVQSALISILENAVDACAEASSEIPRGVRFIASRCRDDIIFDISDNGIGMDREALDTIFTPFFSSKGRKGTGLGLYVARDVIRRHGGDITVESEPGKGSRFQVRIPAKVS